MSENKKQNLKSNSLQDLGKIKENFTENKEVAGIPFAVGQILENDGNDLKITGMGTGKKGKVFMDVEDAKKNTATAELKERIVENGIVKTFWELKGNKGIGFHMSFPDKDYKKIEQTKKLNPTSPKTTKDTVNTKNE